MIYVTSLCLFFILLPLFIVMLKNLIWFFSGPKDDSDYHSQIYREEKNKKIIEFTIELIIIIFTLFLFIIVNHYI